MLMRISAEHYDRFVAACDNKSPEYTILKNGCIVHDREAGYDHKMVEILCNREEATKLFEASTKLCPEAAPGIADAKQQVARLPHR
jgi:hypothetical protein